MNKNTMRTKIRETWEAFKSVETNSEADIDKLMPLLSDDVVMENPMMRAEGKSEVREFLIADIQWSRPVYYWEVFEENRLAMKWSQHPLANEKPKPKLLHSCATWEFDSNGKMLHYYGAWCRISCFEALADAGIDIDPAQLLGEEVVNRIVTSHSA